MQAWRRGQYNYRTTFFVTGGGLLLQSRGIRNTATGRKNRVNKGKTWSQTKPSCSLGR